MNSLQSGETLTSSGVAGALLSTLVRPLLERDFFDLRRRLGDATARGGSSPPMGATDDAYEAAKSAESLESGRSGCAGIAREARRRGVEGDRSGAESGETEGIDDEMEKQTKKKLMSGFQLKTNQRQIEQA